MSKIDILELKEFEKQVDFYANIFRDHLHRHHKAITVPHKHNFFLTVVFTQGTGIHEIDFERYPVQRGSIFMMNPGQAHYWELSDDIDGYVFFHSQAFFDLFYSNQSVYDYPFFYSVHNPSALFVEEAELMQLLPHFRQILSEYQQNYAFSKQKIISIINLVYIELSRIYLREKQSDVLKPDVYAGHLRTFEELIDRHYQQEKSPAVYADWLNITIRHLNRLTQQTLGKSPTQLITERVMLEAKRQIAHQSSSLSEIAYELGYDDYAYFSRLFKKWVGVSPSVFSRAYRV